MLLYIDCESIIFTKSDELLKVAVRLSISSEPKLDKGTLKLIVSPGFKNTLALKDLKLALEQGLLDAINLNTGKTALKIYEDANKTSYKNLDWTSMFNYIKEINQLD